MAGPSILVTIAGEFSKLNAAFSNVASTGSKAAQGLHEAFSGMLGALNKTGVLGPFGQALDGIDQALESVAKHGKDVPVALMGIGGALAGIGVGMQALGSKDQAAHQQLQAAVQATGKDYEDYAAQVEAAIKTQERFGHTAVETQNALQALTQATHDPQKALDLMGTAANLAAAKHEDLATAAGQIGKALGGAGRIFKEFGITVDKNADGTKNYQGAVDQLGKVLSGQASAAADTFGGRVGALKAKLEDTFAAFGTKYGPMVTALGTAMAGLGAAIQILTVIATAAGISIGAAFIWVVVIAVAIAALIAIGYLLYRNWDTIWSGIKSIIETVWTWIKQNWPLLVAVLLGPFAIAAVEIKRHWDDIKQWAKDAVNGIVAAWGKVEDFFKGIGRAIGDALGGVVKWFEELPGKIGDALAKLPGQLTDALTTAIALAIVAMIDEAYYTIKGLWIFFTDIVPHTVELLAGWGAALAGMAVDAVAAMVAGLVGAAQSVWGFFTSVIPRVISFLAGLPGTLLNIGYQAVIFLANGAHAAAAAVWNFFWSMPGQIWSFLSGLPGTLYGIGVAAIQGLMNGIGAMTSAVWSFFTGIGGWISRAVGNLGGILFGAGQAIIQGFIDGITSMFGAVGNAASSIVQKVRDHLPFSPAKEGPFSGSGWTDVAKSGRAVVEQFASGMASFTPQLNVALPGAIAGTSGGASSAAAVAGLGGGPAVHIENVNLADGADIDMLVHKLAFAATAGRL